MPPSKTPPKTPEAAGPVVELHDAKAEVVVEQPTNRTPPPLRKPPPGATPRPEISAANILRRETPHDNLPKPGKHTALLESQGTTRELKQAARPAEDDAYYAKKRNTGLRLQRLKTGYRVTVDLYEGDAHVGRKVYDKLTALGARERIAMHMAGFWAVID